MNRKLYVVAEGDTHTLLYLVRCGIIPDHYFTEPLVLKKFIPYLSDDDDVLFIVQGLTDFKLVELYTVVSDILDNGTKARVTVMSSVKLVKFPMTYYLYDGDLLFGKVYGVTNERLIDLDIDDKKVKKVKAKGVKKVEQVEKKNKPINKVMLPFLDYSSEKEIDIVTDNEFSRKELKKEKSLYSSLIHKVNIWG